MTKERKIILQDKIIRNLQEQNDILLKKIEELEKIINENELALESANLYREEHLKYIASLSEAKENYVQATRELMIEKKKYKKEMEGLFRTTKKFI